MGAIILMTGTEVDLDSIRQDLKVAGSRARHANSSSLRLSAT